MPSDDKDFWMYTAGFTAVTTAAISFAFIGAFVPMLLQVGGLLYIAYYVGEELP